MGSERKQLWELKPSHPCFIEGTRPALNTAQVRISRPSGEENRLEIILPGPMAQGLDPCRRGGEPEMAGPRGWKGCRDRSDPHFRAGQESENGIHLANSSG